MNASRVLLFATMLATAAIAFSGVFTETTGISTVEPAAASPDDPHCLQVHPWSQLCEDGPVALYCDFFKPEGVFAEPCTL